MKPSGHKLRDIVILLFFVSGLLYVYLLNAGFTRQKEPLPVPSLLHYPPSVSTGNDPSPLGDFVSISLPLKRAGRLLVLEAEIDGVKGNLVFDTGATGLVLNKTYFRKHVSTDIASSNGITGSTGTIEQTIVDKVIISDLSYEKIKADVTDLGHLENRRNVKIIGLLGYNMIKSFEVVIDISQNELQLHRLDKKGERLLKENVPLKFDLVQKIDPWRPVMIVKGEVGGKTLNFCFDTGAESNALNSHNNKAVLSKVSILRRSDLRGAGQAKQEVLFGIMNDFRFENKAMNGMETIIVNLDALSEVYGLRIDGILGFGFLEKGVITFNLTKKQFGMHFFKTEEQ